MSVLDDNQSEISSLSSDDSEDYTGRDKDSVANRDISDESDDQSDEASEDEENASKEHVYK